VGQNWYGGTDQYTYMKSFQVNQFLPSEGQDKPFQYRTKVRALGAKKVKVFTKDNMHYFVTANSYHKMGNLYHVKSTMHIQTTYGYQLVQEFNTQGAQDVEVVVIDGRRFLFFANKMDNAGKVDIYSIVYVEHDVGYRGRSPFKLYQRIGTHGARDFEYFTFGGNHYLAVANEYTHVKSMDARTGRPITMNNYQVDSVIYWWTGTMWVQWQLIPTNGAVKWSYFTSPFDDPMLVVSNTRGPPVIFTYEPLRGLFVPTQKQDISPIPGQPDLVSDTRSVMPFKTKGDVFLAVANYDPTYKNGYNIFKIDFEMRPVEELEPTIPEVIMAHLKKMKEELYNLRQSLTTLLNEVANKVMTKSTAQNITSDLTVEELTITDTLTTENFYYRIRVNNDPLKINNAEVEKLLQRLNEKESQLTALEAMLADAVLLTEDASITGKKILTKSLTVDGNFTTDTLEVSGLIDGTNITDLNARTLKKSANQTIHGIYNFTEDITLNTAQVERINNRNVSSFMTTNTEQIVTGMKTFNDNVTVDRLSLENFTVNGLRIPEDVVTSDGNHTITGKKEFGDVEIKNLELHGLLNGVNVTMFNRNKMTLTTDQVIQSVVFSNGFFTSSGITVGGVVDGVNLTDIGRDRSNEVEQIHGSKTFKKVIVKGHSTVNHINDYDFNKTVTLDTDQIIDADMTFLSDLQITGHLHGNVSINGLSLSDQVVTKHGNQTIGGHKTFNAPIFLQENLVTYGKIDGVDIQSWYRNAVFTYTDEPITGTKWFNGGVNIMDKLDVGYVNGIDVNALKENIVWITTNKTQWASEFHFEDVTVENLVVSGTLNDYRIPDDFVLLNSTGPIFGVKEFRNGSGIHGNVSVDGDLSGKNFTEFYDSVLKNNTDERINGNVVFLNDMNVDNVNVTGTINDLYVPDDIVTTTTWQNISTAFTFTSDTRFEGSIRADKIIVNQTVNGVDVSEMYENAVHKDGNQTINGTVVFVGGIDCRQNLSVAGLINGVNLTELMDMTVRVSKDQTISGVKTFTKDVLLEAPMLTPGTINGVNVSELDGTILKTSGNQTFGSNLIINGNVTVNSVGTDGTKINGIDFEKFVKNAARKGEHNTINGSIQFTNGLQVTNLVTQLVDGINISEVLLTRFDQKVTGNLSFTSASFAGNLSVTSGALNGVNIERLNKQSFKLNSDQIITGKYTFGHVQIDGNLSVAGKINSIDLVEFDSAAVHTSGDEIITGHKVFGNVTVSNVNITGLFNGVNITLLFEDTLKKTGYQEVCQRKTFTKSVTTLSNTTVNNILVKNLVNGVNITKLDTEAVKLDGTDVLRGNYTFNSVVEVHENVTINDELNGLAFPGEYMTTFSDQVISGLKTFKQAVLKNLNVTGLVDGFNLSDINQNRVTLSGKQELHNLTFHTVELFEDMNFPNFSTINNIDVSEELVPVDKPSSISGTKTFNSTYIRGNLEVYSGMVNGINLTQLEMNTIKLNSTSKQYISADQLFEKDLIILGNLTVHGLVNGVQVSDIQHHSVDVSEQIKSELDVLSLQVERLCNVTTSIMPIAMTKQVLAGIEKVDIFKSFPLDADLGSVHSTQIGDDIYVSIARAKGSGCGPAYILKCDQLMECEIHQIFETNALDIEFFEYQTQEAVLVSHWDSGLNNTCKSESEIFVFKANAKRYLPHQSLNKKLFESEYAPYIKSSTILQPYIEKAYGKYKTDKKSSERTLPRDIKSFKHADKEYLVVGGYEEDSDFVDVLHVVGKNLSFIRVQQRIKSNGRHVSVGKLNGKRPVIATSSDGQQGSIQLYAFNEKKNKFEFYQRVNKAASTMSIKKMKDKQYLLHASPTNGFGLCEWRGVSGYGGCSQLQATDTTSVETIITSSGAYVLAGTDKSLLIYRTMFEGNSDPYEQPVC